VFNLIKGRQPARHFTWQQKGNPLVLSKITFFFVAAVRSTERDVKLKEKHYRNKNRMKNIKNQRELKNDCSNSEIGEQMNAKGTDPLFQTRQLNQNHQYKAGA
jgi:hypothetical protein